MLLIPADLSAAILSTAEFVDMAGQHYDNTVYPLQTNYGSVVKHNLTSHMTPVE